MEKAVQEYFLEKDFNCAEATLQILDEKYHLGLAAEDYKLVSGFGAGCGCGMMCGALAGCISAMGKMLVTPRAHATPNFKETCAAYCASFSEALGGTDCAVLRPKYFREDVRCAEVLDKACQCFDAFAEAQGWEKN